MPIGFRVYTRVVRPDSALVHKFMPLHSADISDAMNRSRTMDKGIKPLYLPIQKFVGTAITVSVPTGAFYVVKEAMQQTQSGDVLVINAYGNLFGALLGGNVCRGLKARGLAGIVADGAIRDTSEIREEGLPVHARAITTVMGPLEGPGEVNVPIACGQVVVNPGDIILADEDGIVVVPPAEAEEVLSAVAKLEADHAAVQEILLRGEVANIANIEKKLHESRCEFIAGQAK
jgi:regulator of RNase E activity RraA